MGRPQVIFPGGDGWLRAFEPKTGKLIWRFDCNPKAAVYELNGRGARNNLVATPVVHNDKLYIGVGQDPEHEYGVGHLWCIDLVRATRFGPANNGQDVSPVNDNFDPMAAVNKRSALAWHYGGKFNKDESRQMGRSYRFGRTMSCCAVHRGLVYVAELAGRIHCLDAKSGGLYWTHNMNGDTYCSPYWVDGKVYIGNDVGDVFVFAHGKKKKLLAVNEFEERIRRITVAANGVLYVVGEHAIHAIANDTR